MVVKHAELMATNRTQCNDLVSQAKPDPSIIGLVQNVSALIVMVPVAMIQRHVGRALRKSY